jgi:hypothetical protein
MQLLFRHASGDDANRIGKGLDDTDLSALEAQGLQTLRVSN